MTKKAKTIVQYVMHKITLLNTSSFGGELIVMYIGMWECCVLVGNWRSCMVEPKFLWGWNFKVTFGGVLWLTL